MIVAILGILKAGGAYVPLDPDEPEERARLIVKDASVKALITEGRLAHRWPCLGVPTVLIDEESGALDCQGDTDLAPAASPTSLAYVMYTSGSTGEPKGVLIENRSVVRLVRGVDYATFGPDRVFLQLAPVAFDASTFEIWGALLHGARLVLAPDGPPDLAELGRLIEAQGVTTLWLTAGLFNEIVESRPATLAGVREILTGGEALSPQARLDGLSGDCPSRFASSTGTARRSARRSPAATRSTLPGSRPRTTSRSAGRSAIRGPTSSTATGSRSRREWRASCTSAATGWRGVT